VIGVDDAGRGVLVGPMVVAGILATGEQLEKLKALGVKDSKKLSERQLVALAKIVKANVQDFCIKAVSAERMNKRDKKLDDFEREAMAEIVKELGGGEVVADFVSRPERLVGFKFVKGEKSHIAVDAASVLASEHYLRACSALKKEYGDFGSGNPNDLKTIGWLRQWWKENGRWPPVVRTFYRTIERLEAEKVLPAKV